MYAYVNVLAQRKSVTRSTVRQSSCEMCTQWQVDRFFLVFLPVVRFSPVSYHLRHA